MISHKEQELIKNGYREFQKNPLIHPYCTRVYQKRFDDQIGKKYFVNAEYYNDQHGETIEYNFQFSIGKGKDERFINFRLLEGWTLEEMESHVEKMWKDGQYNYYEKWEY